MLEQTFVICEKEIRSMMHNPYERLFRLLRPMLWLVLFGSVFRLTSLTPGVSYQQFMLPGIFIHTIVVTAVDHGITIRWEADLGILSRLLAAPVRRLSIVLGKALSSVVKASMDGAFFLFLAWLIQIRFAINAPSLLLSSLVVTILVIGISSLGMGLALILRSREAYVGVVGLIATPSLFASNSLYNLNQMPSWLRLIAEINPVTYGVDAIRRAIIYNSFDPVYILFDLGVLFLFTAVILVLTVFLFNRIGH